MHTSLLKHQICPGDGVIFYFGPIFPLAPPNPFENGGLTAVASHIYKKSPAPRRFDPTFQDSGVFEPTNSAVCVPRLLYYML